MAVSSIPPQGVATYKTAVYTPLNSTTTHDIVISSTLAKGLYFPVTILGDASADSATNPDIGNTMDNLIQMAYLENSTGTVYQYIYESGDVAQAFGFSGTGNSYFPLKVTSSGSKFVLKLSVYRTNPGSSIYTGLAQASYHSSMRAVELSNFYAFYIGSQITTTSPTGGAGYSIYWNTALSTITNAALSGYNSGSTLFYSLNPSVFAYGSGETYPFILGGQSYDTGISYLLPRICYSTNGTNWAAATFSTVDWSTTSGTNYNGVIDILHDGTTYRAFGSISSSGFQRARVWTSNDGTVWTTVAPSNASTLLSLGRTVYLATATDKYVSVYGASYGGADTIATSTDAVTWTIRSTGLTTQSIYGLTVENGRFYISTDNYPSLTNAPMAYSTNGTTWTLCSVKYPMYGAWGSPRFITTNRWVCPTDTGLALSTDGVSWEVTDQYEAFTNGTQQWPFGRFIVKDSTNYLFYHYGNGGYVSLQSITNWTAAWERGYTDTARRFIVLFPNPITSEVSL